jgi:hypothetical protein
VTKFTFRQPTTTLTHALACFVLVKTSSLPSPFPNHTSSLPISDHRSPSIYHVTASITTTRIRNTTNRQLTHPAGRRKHLQLPRSTLKTVTMTFDPTQSDVLAIAGTVVNKTRVRDFKSAQHPLARYYLCSLYIMLTILNRHATFALSTVLSPTLPPAGMCIAPAQILDPAGGHFSAYLLWSGVQLRRPQVTSTPSSSSSLQCCCCGIRDILRRQSILQQWLRHLLGLFDQRRGSDLPWLQKRDLQEMQGRLSQW